MHIIGNGVLVISLFFLPWWITFIIALGATLYIRNFYEVIIYGIFFDALYGTSVGLHGFSYWGTTTAIIFFMCAFMLRDKISIGE